MKGIKILEGDCIELLKTLEDESVDLLCTDPPYALTSVDPKRPGGGRGESGFMGKKWDKAVPSVEVWRECLRVLKPGAFAFVMCAPRQDCLARMIVNLEDAGFVTGYSSLYYCFASGFPKAQNLSKAADRRAGKKREVVGTKLGQPGYSLAPDKGRGAYNCAEDGSWRDSEKECQITAPATPEAKALDGAYAGAQFKPAVEIILVVMKPLGQPTYLDQALANGKGCTWLDDGRIPTAESLNGGAYAEQGSERWDGAENWRFKRDGGAGEYVQPTGRFPANLLVQDDALNDGQVTASPQTYQRKANTWDTNSVYGPGIGEHVGAESLNFGDSGSFSRFFDLDAWHEEAMKKLPERIRRVFPFMPVAKPSKREKNRGLEGHKKKNKREVYGDGFNTATKVDPKIHTKEGMENRPRHANIHPTVKPQKLLQYLVTIGSRKGDVVLDPYMGSGTTGVACMLLGREFVGMELDPEYAEIARGRIFGCLGPLFAKVAREESEEE